GRATLEGMEGCDSGFKGEYLERAEQLLFAFFDKYLADPKEERKILVSNHGAAGEVMALSWPSGRVLWRVPNQHGHDVQGLADGHVLYTIGPAHKVVEIDRDRRPVWEYGAGEGLEHPLAAERLANGNTLIGDAKLGKVIEVDHAKKIVWKYETPDMANMRMRSCRSTDAGTVLIAIEAAGKIIEVGRAGKIVWPSQFEPKRLAYQAHRVKNGNTLVSLADPGEVVEVSRDGKVARSIAGARDDLKMSWA